MKLRHRPQPALALLSCAITAPVHAERAVFNFNSSWRLAVADPANAHEVAFDDALWKPVTLPRAWNEDDAFGKDIVDHSTGVA